MNFSNPYSRYTLRNVIASLFILGFIGACSANGGADAVNSDSEEGATESTDTPQRGGELVVIEEENIAPSLDKLRDGLLGAAYPISQIMQPLSKIEPDGTATPLLAEDFEQSEDGLSWTITLRDADFSNGDKVEAEDVVFTLENLKDEEHLYSFLFDAIETVEAVESDTVEVQLSRPDDFLPEALAIYSAGVIPKNWGDKSEAEFYEHPIGAGPFMLNDTDDWKVGQEITLQANPHYWEDGRPYLDAVTFRKVADENQRLLQIQGGQAHATTFPQPSAATNSLEGTDGVLMDYHEGYMMLYIQTNLRDEK